MNLVIFDIDGTLTKTNEIDHKCFIDSVQRLIYPKFDRFEPEAFTHFTDSNILIELYERYQNRYPTAKDERQFKTMYLEALEKAKKEQPAHFQPVSGAKNILRSLPKDWAVALATGCWLESALIKLNGGDVWHGDLPKGTASDALSRADVMRSAIEKSKHYYQKKAFERIVYVGDGIWDVRTCAELGIPLVGIEAEGKAHKKRNLGRHFMLEGYPSIELLVDILHKAEIPDL